MIERRGKLATEAGAVATKPHNQLARAAETKKRNARVPQQQPDFGRPKIHDRLGFSLENLASPKLLETSRCR
jgi:hypothetical protein